MHGLDRLTEAITKAGKPVHILNGSGGERILVLPHGGRVLGLFAADGGGNFLWAHPALKAAGSARALFASDEWCNTGGDRTWLAPEAELFFPEFPERTVYRQPRELDAGTYRCGRHDGAIRLCQDLAVVAYRRKERIPLRITKEIRPAENPLRFEPAPASIRGVTFAGYVLRSKLELPAGASRTAVGLWHLLQLPPGGEMIIPTYSRAKPTLYFGRISRKDLSVRAGLIRYRMGSPGAHKIGVRAAATTGRVGYVCRSDRRWRLVIRQFTADPGGLYADYPPGKPEEGGCAVQVCSVCDPRLGRFSELEYHAPAIGGPTGLAGCRDASQVWAFEGSARQIRAIAAALVGAEFGEDALRRGRKARPGRRQGLRKGMAS